MDVNSLLFMFYDLLFSFIFSFFGGTYSCTTVGHFTRETLCLRPVFGVSGTISIKGRQHAKRCQDSTPSPQRQTGSSVVMPISTHSHASQKGQIVLFFEEQMVPRTTRISRYEAFPRQFAANQVAPTRESTSI